MEQQSSKEADRGNNQRAARHSYSSHQRSDAARRNAKVSANLVVDLTGGDSDLEAGSVEAVGNTLRVQEFSLPPGADGPKRSHPRTLTSNRANEKKRKRETDGGGAPAARNVRVTHRGTKRTPRAISVIVPGSSIEAVRRCIDDGQDRKVARKKKRRRKRKKASERKVDTGSSTAANRARESGAREEEQDEWTTGIAAQREKELESRFAGHARSEQDLAEREGNLNAEAAVQEKRRAQIKSRGKEMDDALDESLLARGRELDVRAVFHNDKKKEEIDSSRSGTDLRAERLRKELEEFDSRKTELDAQAAAQLERQRQLEVLKAEMDARLSHQRSLEAAIQTSQAESEALAAKLARKAAALDSRKKELDAEAASQEKVERNLAHRREGLEKRSLVQASSQKFIEMRRAKLDAREIDQAKQIAELEARKIELDEQAASILDLERAVSALKEEVERRSMQLASEQAALNVQERNFRTRASEQASEAVKLEARKRELDASAAAQEQKKEELNRVQARLEKEKSEMDRIQARLEKETIDLVDAPTYEEKSEDRRAPKKPGRIRPRKLSSGSRRNKSLGGLQGEQRAGATIDLTDRKGARPNGGVAKAPPAVKGAAGAKSGEGCNFILIDDSDEEDAGGTSSKEKKPPAIQQGKRGRPQQPMSFDYEQNFNYSFTQESAAELQEKMLRDAAARVRARASFGVVSGQLHQQQQQVPVLTEPVFDIAEKYPQHWNWTDPHARLGLPPNASLKLVKSQYRRLARLYHPDKARASDAAAKFHAVTLAYRALAVKE